MSTHAERMARVLASRGVEYVFGLPGGEILAFVDACRRAGLRFVLTGHEASAAWIAQVLGHIRGVPGVCASTLGPGATNLVTGVANAMLDRAPLLAVTAQIPAEKIATMTHQRVRLERLFAPITKCSVEAGTGDSGELTERCLDLAMRPRAGPVHIALASDVAVRECEEGNGERVRETEALGDEAAVSRIAARVNASERPLVLIGLGATAECAPGIARLVEKLAAPVLVTAKAKGMAPEDHPQFAGVASGMMLDREIVETIRRADLLIGIGFDPVECDKTWFAEAEVVAIDAASMAEGEYRPTEAIGDIAALLARVTEQITGPKRWAAEPPRPRAGEGELSPLRVIEELRRVLPDNGIATCDVGSHKLLMGQFWKSYQPGTFFMSNGLSGMGFGIPAAIGAQLAHPDRPVLAVVGDGGMLMMLHDLTLIRELGLPIVIAALVDRSLSLIRVAAERRGMPPYGVDFTPPDFAQAAEAFGIAGRRAGSLDEMRECVEDALTRRVPMLVEIAIDFREYYELV